METCKHKHTELDGTCASCGLTEEWRTIECLKEEVRDLKARLKAVERDVGVVPWACNLRVKNWRKP